MNRLDRLDARVRELEKSFEELQRAVREAEAETLELELEGELGYVTVSGAGGLSRIDLDPHALRYSRSGTVEKELVEAINEAESTLAQACRNATRNVNRAAGR